MPRSEKVLPCLKEGTAANAKACRSDLWRIQYEGSDPYAVVIKVVTVAPPWMRSKNKGMSGACIHSGEKIAGTRCPSTTRCQGPQVVEKLLKTGASDNHQEPESFGRRDSKLALDHWVGRLQCGSVHKGEGTHAGPQTPRSREKHGALLRPDDRGHAVWSESTAAPMGPDRNRRREIRQLYPDEASAATAMARWATRKQKRGYEIDGPGLHEKGLSTDG